MDILKELNTVQVIGATVMFISLLIFLAFMAWMMRD